MGHHRRELLQPILLMLDAVDLSGDLLEQPSAAGAWACGPRCASRTGASRLALPGRLPSNPGQFPQKSARLHRLPVARETPRALDAAKRAGLRVPGDRVGNPRATGEGEEKGASMEAGSHRRMPVRFTLARS